ncbi:MAG: glycosyltransferase family 4 protein [Chitinophagaceae bacterium]|nr:glycosyltransferase family 4 protein [Chitinophagaceae bacterium]
MNTSVNILSLVSYPFLPPKMGGQKGIALFNQYLGALLSLQCLTIQNNDPSFARNYIVFNQLSNSKWRYSNPAYFFLLKKIIKEKKITHLILEHPYYGWLGVLLKWFTPVKLIVHSHNIEATRFKSMGKWWWGVLWHYEKMTHRRADLNFFIQDADRQFAVTKFKLDPEKCATITYGFELDQAPSASEKRSAKETLIQQHGLPPDTRIILFNGTLDYAPNREALDIILDKINPLLLVKAGFNYRIIICGNRLPDEYNGLTDHKTRNVLYAGFVDDISLYFKGADIFINPVTEGGGIKTKVVESLGYDLYVISTRSGAIGIPPDITNGKLFIIEDDDWKGFAEKIIDANLNATIPDAFFRHFYWGHIAGKAAALISKC